MKYYEYRVIVTTTDGIDRWYTLQRRRWVGVIPLWWSNVLPMYQPTFELAMSLKTKESNETH
jgi:hypothetical protein